MTRFFFDDAFDSIDDVSESPSLFFRKKFMGKTNKSENESMSENEIPNQSISSDSHSIHNQSTSSESHSIPNDSLPNQTIPSDSQSISDGQGDGETSQLSHDEASHPPTRPPNRSSPTENLVATVMNTEPRKSISETVEITTTRTNSATGINEVINRKGSITGVEPEKIKEEEKDNREESIKEEENTKEEETTKEGETIKKEEKIKRDEESNPAIEKSLDLTKEDVSTSDVSPTALPKSVTSDVSPGTAPKSVTSVSPTAVPKPASSDAYVSPTALSPTALPTYTNSSESSKPSVVAISSSSSEPPVSVSALTKMLEENAADLALNPKQTVQKAVLPLLATKSSKHKFAVQTTTVPAQGAAGATASLGAVWDAQNDGYASFSVGNVYVTVIWIYVG